MCDFSIEVTNYGPDDATGVEVLDMIPSGYSFEYFTASQGEYSENTGVWNVGTVEADTSETLTITVTVLSQGEWLNCAEVINANETDVDSILNNSEENEDDYACAYTIPELLLVVPEGFSPNGDGINDTFEIPNLEVLYPNFSMEITRRWGNTVYKYEHSGVSSQNPKWWDGYSSSGKLNLGDGVLPTGTYFYVIELNENGKKPLTGWVYLRR